MIDQQILTLCNFNTKAVSGNIVSLSWDASSLANEKCSMYKVILKSSYADYLSTLELNEKKELFPMITPLPEKLENGTGTLLVLEKDIEEMEAEIISVVNSCICDEKSLQSVVTEFFDGDKPTIEVTSLTLLGSEYYRNSEGILAGKDAYFINIDVVNNLYANVSFDYSGLDKLKSRKGTLQMRIDHIYLSYAETKEIHYDPEDTTGDYYIHISDVAMFVNGISKIFKEEIQMEYSK